MEMLPLVIDAIDPVITTPRLLKGTDGENEDEDE
jgi:hypothetical protein